MNAPQIPRSFGGAVDLSSLSKPKVTSASTSNVPEATAENFISDFIEKSREIPVLILAYSERSPAAIQLRDLLAKIAESDGGTWRFGAVNLEAQPKLIQALRIQSVPTAYAFIAEQALPLPELPPREDQIRALLSQIFTLAKERGLAVNVPDIPEPKLEPEEAAALSAMERGDFSGAAMAYRNWLQRSPGETMAKIGLAQCELMIRIAPLNPELTIAKANSDPRSLSDAMMASDLEIAHGQVKNAFDRLLTIIKESKGEDRDRAKAHLIELFQLVDPRDPELIKARQTLASVLF